MRPSFRERLESSVILFDGGMGTEIYKRGVFINTCYDALNLTNPSLILQIHQDYVRAGADVIETNTFGANPAKLAAHGLGDRIFQINHAGATLAREAAGEDVWVAGSIGPLGIQIEPLGPLSLDEAMQAYASQVLPLLEGGVDLFILETFIYSTELRQAIRAVRNQCDLPIIAQMTINDDGSSLTGADPDILIEELESLGADVIGVNCTVGPAAMLSWLERARELTALPISVMPNAGKPRNVDGRNIYLTSPEYLGSHARRFIQCGANVLGGCCGTGPEHIRQMREVITAIAPVQRKIVVEPHPTHGMPDVEVTPRENKSRLASRLSAGRFVTFVEIVSPRGVSAAGELGKARLMNYHGIDVINIPDGPRASARMSALALAVQIQREVGIETVLHYTCRDRNVIGMQSDLLGAHALGLRNILAVTGDPPKLGNYPDATAVFDVDAIGLVNIIHRLNLGLDIAGNPIGPPTAFHTGVAANPAALNLDHELRRLDWKVEAGAEFIVTQPVFDVEVFTKFMNHISHIRIPVIAGLWPLASLRNAEFMKNEVPGCVVPDSLIERMRGQDSKEGARAEGVAISREILSEIRPFISGVQISVPFGRMETVDELLDGMETQG